MIYILMKVILKELLESEPKFKLMKPQCNQFWLKWIWLELFKILLTKPTQLVPSPNVKDFLKKLSPIKNILELIKKTVTQQ